MLAVALAYVKSGFHIFPCKLDKTPLTEHGFKDATDEPELVEFWWRKWPKASIGIPTGTVNRIAVIDVDPRNGGHETLTEWQLRNFRLPDTKRCVTGGGGQHLWYALLDPLRSRPAWLPGVDIKADGGYVIAPPSPHPSGKLYSWEPGAKDIVMAPFPLRLREALETSEPRDAGKVAQELPAEIPEGQRHDLLLSLAGSMRRRGCVEAEILAALREANKRCRPPENDGALKELARTVCKYPTQADPSAGKPRQLTGEFQGKFVSLGQLLKTEFPPLDWLVSRIVVQGAVGWIGGPPKLGKSMLGLHMALCVATGVPFLGEFAVKHGKALYVSEEDPERIVFRRAQRMLAGTETEMLDLDSFQVLCKSGFKLDRPDHLSWLNRHLAAWKPNLIVFDVFNRLHTGDVNKANEMLPIMVALDRIRTEHGCTIQTVIHFKKPQEGQSQDMIGSLIAGSLALHAFSECSLYLRRKDEKSRITFEAKEFEAAKDVILSIVGNEDEGRIGLACDPLHDQAEVGAKNRQIACTAFLESWEKAGRPLDGVKTSEIMAQVSVVGAEFSARTLQRHLKSSGYDTRVEWTKAGKDMRYNPDWRLAAGESVE